MSLATTPPPRKGARPPLVTYDPACARQRCDDCARIAPIYQMADGRRLCATCVVDGDSERARALYELRCEIELEVGSIIEEEARS